MPAPDVQLYLFYLGCVVVACLVISLTAVVVRRRRRSAFRREILRSVLGAREPEGQSVPDARSSLRSPVSQLGREPFGRQHRPGGRPEPIPSERKQKWEEARKLAQSGWSLDQIVSRLQLGYDEARIALLGDRVIVEAGNGRSERGPSRAAKARQLAEEGMSPAEIGKRLGMSLQEVELISHVA